MPKSPFISTVEAHGWSLYDSHELEHPDAWDKREPHQPASAIKDGRAYIFVPQPTPGQSLGVAYTAFEEARPCLRVKDPDSPEYESLRIGKALGFAIFTRFAMQRSVVTLYTPPTSRLLQTDLVVLNPDTALAVFERDFDIAGQQKLRQYAGYWHAWERRS
jgi:hypothetical protein